MRVLKVVQSYFPFQDRGGPVVKVRALARGLVERGHHVTVLTADLGLRKPENHFALPLERSSWGWCSDQDGVEVIYLATRGHYRALTINPPVLGFSMQALSRFDVVHFYGLYDLLGPPIGYFCRRRRTPYVIEPMGMFRPIDRGFLLKRLWHGTAGSAYLRGAARLIATSEMEREDLVEDGVPPEKLVIRYNGIDFSSCLPLPPRGAFRAEWNIPASEPVILFLSRLIPRKGADILIEAFAETCQDSGRLVIAGPEGETGYRAFLERRARECRVADRVLFTGPVYDDAKKAMLADADIFALPSRYENFANAAAEAIACGIPVIVTDRCGIRSLVEGQAGLVIAPKREPLAAALRQLLSDKLLYARLKEGCNRVASQLRWDCLAEQMEACYGEVLHRA